MRAGPIIVSRQRFEFGTREDQIVVVLVAWTQNRRTFERVALNPLRHKFGRRFVILGAVYPLLRLDHLNEVTDLPSGPGNVAIRALETFLLFDSANNPFCEAILVRPADGSHADLSTGIPQQIVLIFSGVSRPLVGVMRV